MQKFKANTDEAKRCASIHKATVENAIAAKLIQHMSRCWVLSRLLRLVTCRTSVNDTKNVTNL